MAYQTIRLEIDTRGIATVTLARPDKHNALNAQVIDELSEGAAELAGNAAVRGVVLTGQGRTFCAGGDLGWMCEQAEKDRAGKIDEAKALAGMLGAWNALPKPVVARVQGASYGGGLGLMAIADIVVAADNAKFALTETRLGLIPATIGPFVVSKLGPAFARQVFFNSRPFGPDFGLRSGLVTRIAPSSDLGAAVEEEVVAFLDCAPGAVTDAKALCRKLSGTDPFELAEMTANVLADRWEADEAQAGITAFFAKEQPPWRKN